MKLTASIRTQRTQTEAKRSSRPKWHYIYYLLAVFDLFTVSFSLYLNHQIMKIYAQSVEVNQKWAMRLQNYSELGQRAAAVNAPGNDVFDSRNAVAESQRLQTALHRFQEHMDAIRQELRTNVDQRSATLLLKNLYSVDAAIAEMTSEANLIFSYFRQNQPEIAGRRMATMDRKYNKVNTAFAHLRQSVSEIQQQVFYQQKIETDALKKYEYAIAAFILVMVISVTLYGHKLAQQIYSNTREKEQSIEKLQQVEAHLKNKNQQLEQALENLQLMQTQLVKSEKMSALGVMVAGVAHEINNPVNFIHGNLVYVQKYTQDLLGLVQLYQQHYPHPTAKIQEKIAAIELDFLEEDLTKLLKSMTVGTERIDEIVKSLRNFSRLDQAEFKQVNIHEGIDSTLMILHNRLKVNPNHPEIEVIKEYGQLPLVDCYPGQLNQVFMNILSNAIDAIDECNKQRTTKEIKANPGMIRIRTEVFQGNSVAIHIADNGLGMNEQVRSKLFDPFFTTKPVGKGTGLGLSISYQIVVEKHGGQLSCVSEPGQGSEFCIEIPIRQSTP